MIEYHIIVINNDDSEERLKIIFVFENEAFRYARKNIINRCRIMKIEYHIENNKKIYDDEICVYSEIDDD